jgi:hypothetical protein
MKLCKRGYQNAKQAGKYPSAWLNTYGSRVCRGIEPDLDGEIYIGDKRPSSVKTGKSKWRQVNEIIDRRKITQQERSTCKDCILNKKTGKYVFKDSKVGKSLI